MKFISFLALFAVFSFSKEYRVLGSQVKSCENLDLTELAEVLRETTNTDGSDASGLSSCINKKLETSDKAEDLALELAKCNFEAFQIVEFNCKYLGRKWGNLGRLLETLQPKCFSNLQNNKFFEFPIGNLKYIRPSIFEWVSESDLTNLLNEVADVNFISDQQFNMINKSAFSEKHILSIKMHSSSLRKQQTLRFATRNSFLNDCMYEPIGKESTIDLNAKLVTMVNLPKLTALLLGDILLKELRDEDTYLEGGELEDTSSFLSILIKLAVKDHKELQTDKISSLTRQIHHINCLARIRNSSLHQTVSYYSRLVENLPEEESMLFPYGWASNSTGHAMLLQVTKLENDLVYLRVYNSGAGLETYHIKKRFDSRFKYLPYIRTKPFHYMRFKETNFFDVLYALNVAQIDSTEEFSAKDAYGVILSRFDIEYENSINDDKFIMAQFSGTCSMRSILAFLHANLSLREYQLLKHAISVKIVLFLSIPPSELWINLLIRFTQYLIKDLIPLNLKDEYEKLYFHLKMLQLRKRSLSFEMQYQESVRSVMPWHLIQNWANQSNFKKFGFLDKKIPDFPKYLDSVLNWKPISSNENLEILENILEQHSGIYQPPDYYSSYISSGILEIPVNFDVTENPHDTLRSLKSITFTIVKFAATQKERNIAMLSAANRILFVAWNAAKAADNMQFQDCVECKMETYGFTNPISLSSKKGSDAWYIKKSIVGSPLVFKEFFDTSPEILATKPGILDDFAQGFKFFTIDSPIFRYLSNFKEAKNLVEARARIMKLSNLKFADYELILTSLLFTERELLPPQFIVFRDIFFMLQLLFKMGSRNDSEGKYILAIKSLTENSGNVLCHLHNQSIIYKDKNMVQINLFNIEALPTLLDERFLAIALEPRIERYDFIDSFNPFVHLLEFSTISFPGFVSLALHDGFLIEDFYNQQLLHQSLYSLMDFAFHKITPSYLLYVLAVYDRLLKNLEPFLDCSVPSMHEKHTGKSSYFEQFAFLMFEKINFAFKFSMSVDTHKIITSVRDRINLQLKDLENEDADAKYYLYSLLLFSFEGSSMSNDENALQVLYLQFTRKNLGISVSLPLFIESLASYAYFKHLDNLNYRLSKKSFALEASKKIFNVTQVDQVGIASKRLYARSGDSIHSVSLVYMDYKCNGVLTLPPKHLLNDNDFVKVFGSSKLPVFSSSYLTSQDFVMYTIKLNEGDYYVLVSSNGKPYVEFHSTNFERFWLIREEEYKDTLFSNAWFNSRTLWFNVNNQEIRICENYGFKNCIGSFDFQSEFKFAGDSTIWTFQSSPDVRLFPSSLDLQNTMFVDVHGKMKVDFERLYDSMGLPLKFSSLGDKITWSANPDFFIGFIDVGLPRHFYAYSILVDDSSKRARLLLPIKTRCDLLFPRKTEKNVMKFEYIVIPIDQKVIVESNVKNLFYLAYLHMIYHEFELAWQFLLKITQIDPFTDDDLKMATWVFTYHLVEEENFPEIYAIEAFVSWLVFENFQNFPKDVKNENKNRSPELDSLYGPASTFRAFWNNQCEFSVAKNEKDKMLVSSYKIALRYYEIAKMLSPKFVFTPHLRHSTALLTEYMEVKWLKSISQNNIHPRLLMIHNRPCSAEVPLLKKSSVDFKELSIHLRKIFDELGRNFCSTIFSFDDFYRLADAQLLLRPNINLIFKLYKSLFSMLLSGTTTERKLVNLYLHDIMHVQESKAKSLVQFLLFLQESIEDTSESCHTALLTIEGCIVTNFEHLWERNLINIQNSCNVTTLRKTTSESYTSSTIENRAVLFLETKHKENFLADTNLPLEIQLGFESDLNYVNARRAYDFYLQSLDFDAFLAQVLSWKRELETNYHFIMDSFEKNISTSNDDYRIMSEGEYWIKPNPADLVTAFIHQNSNSYLKHLPKHSLQNIIQIHQLMLSYFVNQTALARVNGLLLKINEIQSVGSALIKDSLDPLIESIKRPYYVNEKEHELSIIPALLVFEYQSGSSIRKEHIPDLLRLGTGKFENIVLQRMMSSGKTFVLSTLLSILRSAKNYLSILIVPQALLSTNARDIISRNLRFFKIRGRVFRFGRDPKFINEDSLNWILHQLETTVENREYVITTAEDIQSLRNSFIETLMKIRKKQGNINSASILQKILLLFRKRGVALIDEVDWVLNPLTKLRFPVSQPQKLDRLCMELIGELFVRLATKEELLELQITCSNALSVSPATYHTLQPIIINCAVEIIGNKCKTIKTDLIVMILNASEKNQLKLLVSKLSEPDQELLLTIHSFIHSHLPEALGKQVNEHYGLSVKHFQKCRYAKPYVAANTPAADEKSDFSELIVIATKTFRAYFQLKLRPIQIKEMIENLRNKAILEKSHNLILDLKKTETVINFDKCFQFKSLFKIKLTTEKDLDEIIKRTDKECAYRYMVEYIIESTISKLGQFPEQLSSSASNVTSSFKYFDGYSGTIDNPDLFAQVDKNDEIYNIITEKLKKNPKIYIFDGLGLMAVDILKQLDKLISKEKMSRVSALLDIGAYFRKYSNKLVAISIMNWKPSIKAVLFYDESSNDLHYIKANGEDKKAPGSSIEVIESATGLKREEMFLFLDQRHCTGTDIKMSQIAIGLATASDSVMSREWFQGVMRMRDLVKGLHEVLVICPTELTSKMKETLNMAQDSLLGVEDLLNLAEYNSNKYRQLQTYAAFTQKLEDSVQSLVMDKLLSTNIEEAVLLFSTFHDLLVTSMPVTQSEKINEASKILYDKDYIESRKFDLQNLFQNTELEALVNTLTFFKTKLNSVAGITYPSIGEEVHEQWHEQEQEQDQEQDQEEEEIVSAISEVSSEIYIKVWPDDRAVIEMGLSQARVYTSLYVTASASDTESRTLVTWNIQDVTRHTAGFADFSEFFDNRINVTKNFASIHVNEFTLFKATERYFTYEFLIIKHKTAENIPWRVILLSPFDIEELHDKLKLGLADHDIWLLDLQLNVTFFNGKETLPVDIRELRKVLVQIIALSGALNLLSSPDIIELALEWVSKDLQMISAMLDVLVLESHKAAYECSKFKKLMTLKLNSGSYPINAEYIRVVKGLCFLSMSRLREARLSFTQMNFKLAPDNIRRKMLEAVAAIFGLASGISPQWMHKLVENTISGLIDLERNDLDDKFAYFLNQYVTSVFSNDIFQYLLDYIENLKEKNVDTLLKLVQVIGDRLNESTFCEISGLVIYQFHTVLLKLARIGNYLPSQRRKYVREQIVFPKSNFEFPTDLFNKILLLKLNLNYESTYHNFSFESQRIYMNAAENSEFQTFILNMVRAVRNTVSSALKTKNVDEETQWWEEALIQKENKTSS